MSSPTMPGRTLQVLVVDDEEPARALLVEYLATLPATRVAGQCANGFEALREVAALDPDLLLLDVRMPKLDGFDVLELLGRRPGGRPAVVFVTAYDDFAVRAFEVAAVDYLLKPVDPARLATALARVRERLGREPAEEDEPASPALSSAARGGRPADRILVREGEQIHVVPAARLDYAEARDDTVRLVVAGGKVLTKPQTLGELETALDPRRFVRIHRSFLLNLDRLARLERYAKDSHAAILADGTRLPVSRAGYARLRELL